MPTPVTLAISLDRDCRLVQHGPHYAIEVCNLVDIWVRIDSGNNRVRAEGLFSHLIGQPQILPPKAFLAGRTLRKPRTPRGGRPS